MKFVQLSPATIINLDDISHIHVVTDTSKEITAHVFQRGGFPQSRVIITAQEYDVLKSHIILS